MKDPEPIKKPSDSDRLRIALFIVLGVATLCLAGGASWAMGWIISGGLFFLVALPLLFAYLAVKSAEAGRAKAFEPVVLDDKEPTQPDSNASNSVAVTDELPTQMGANGGSKIILGIVVLSIALTSLSSQWGADGPASVGLLFPWIFILLSLWPIFGGVADLRKSRRKER